MFAFNHNINDWNLKAGFSLMYWIHKYISFGGGIFLFPQPAVKYENCIYNYWFFFRNGNAIVTRHAWNWANFKIVCENNGLSSDIYSGKLPQNSKEKRNHNNETADFYVGSILNLLTSFDFISIDFIFWIEVS